MSDQSHPPAKMILPRWMVILAILLPILAVSAMAGQAIWNRNNGEHWRIRIEGYDPRDMLYGHYLNYTYAWNREKEDTGNDCTDGDCCACLSEGKAGRRDPKVSFGDCGTPAIKSCTTVLRSTSSYGFSIDDGRYYIPERKAEALQTMLRAWPEKDQDKVPFYIDLLVHPDGTASRGDLYIGDEPADQYLKR